MTDEVGGVVVADVPALAAADPTRGPVWTHTSTDLNVNAIRFDDGAGVPPHVNTEVDVLVVVIAGEGIIEVEGRSLPIIAGQLCVIPKGVTRAIRSAGGPLLYLTCHRRRGGIQLG